MAAKTKVSRKTSITFRPPVALKKSLVRGAEEEGRTLSGHITHLLQRYVAQAPAVQP